MPEVSKGEEMPELPKVPEAPTLWLHADHEALGEPAGWAPVPRRLLHGAVTSSGCAKKYHAEKTHAQQTNSLKRSREKSFRHLCVNLMDCRYLGAGTGCRPPFLYVRAGRNHLNEEITPSFPTGIGYSDSTKPYQI